ncbi:MAG: glycosyltransferase family 4 protein [Planctomycetes bacterium]|jgi:glycosyltransferase involved in cell wall biosynthesis|nr:glycosyltransferase family 4 protein [Planctomycetota bacterium]
MSIKKKVVILSAFNVPGLMYGAEQFAREICLRLKGDFDITLITVRWDRRLNKREEGDGYRVRRVGIGVKAFDKFFYPLLAAWRVRQLKPDIVHANIESFAGAALLLVKYFYPRAKRILTLQSGNLDVWIENQNQLIKKLWLSIHRSADLITAISAFLANRVYNLGISREKVLVIPNGVDFSEVPPAPERRPDQVLCMGRLSWEKGHEYLLKAWPAVTAVVPAARLVIYGEGEREAEIKELIDRLSITGSVELRPAIPHKEFMAELAKSEVFILPSLAEGLGIVYIEAQASGVPVIGTRVGGIPEVIQDGENGLLVEPKNSQQIVAAVTRLLRDKDLAEKLRARALETVKKYDWRNIIHEISVLYNDVC